MNTSLSSAYIISGENSFGLKSSITFSTWILLGQKWESNPLLHQKSRKSSDAQQQCPLFCFSWETQNPLVPFNFFPFQAEMDLHVFLAHPHALAQPQTSLSSMSFPPDSFFFWKTLPLACCTQGTKAEPGLSTCKEVSWLTDWQQALPGHGICPSESAEVFLRQSKVLLPLLMCVCRMCLLQWKQGFKMSDLNLWGVEADYQLSFSHKKCNKTLWFLFLWGRCWWHDPSDGLTAGLHEGVIFTGS